MKIRDTCAHCGEQIVRDSNINSAWYHEGTSRFGCNISVPAAQPVTRLADRALAQLLDEVDEAYAGMRREILRGAPRLRPRRLDEPVSSYGYGGPVRTQVKEVQNLLRELYLLLCRRDGLTDEEIAQQEFMTAALHDSLEGAQHDWERVRSDLVDRGWREPELDRDNL